MTYSNHRHSQVTVISICISEYDGERVTVKTKWIEENNCF